MPTLVKRTVVEEFIEGENDEDAPEAALEDEDEGEEDDADEEPSRKKRSSSR